MTTFAYDKDARVPLPVMKVVLSDPASRGSTEVTPMVDTGFDGGLLLPLEQYIGLGRQNFEEPGGTFVVRSASGLPSAYARRGAWLPSAESGFGAASIPARCCFGRSSGGNS